MRNKYSDQPKAYVVTAYPYVDRKYPGMQNILNSNNV